MSKKEAKAISPEALEIGQCLKRARERAGLTQSQVAELVGWVDSRGRPNQTRTSFYETGRRRITGVEIKKFADALKIPMYEVFMPEEKLEGEQGSIRPAFSQREKNLLDVWQHAPHEARAVAKDLLQQNKAFARFMDELYWPTSKAYQRHVAYVTEEYRLDDDVPFPEPAKREGPNSQKRDR